ncbi:MAG: bifunctional phosphopantothenoylcysteine decarboxylase/phosphopantothenate--cysteine ligase CoaBC [Candidatus Zixiibacteriota bacterium]
MDFSGKKIIVGVTGGIAAYKSAEIVRSFKKRGAEVRVLMTANGAKFITPLTMETLSENEVITEMFPEKRMVGIRHISLADWADLILVAPATANFIAKVRAGLADDILSTVVISFTRKVIFAPTMNVHMYGNPIVQDNIRELSELGYEFIEPGVGDLACGDLGRGRMAEPEEIAQRVWKALNPKQDLKGKKVVVTASRTEEPIDAVRFISNPSTGKMGFSMAAEALSRGAKVTLISGPTDLSPPSGVSFVRVKTTNEMFEATKKAFKSADILVMAAAPSDFAPKIARKNKIKKSPRGIELTLQPTVDILKELGKAKGKRILVGFAIETENEVANAKKKLKSKNLDLIVLNNPLRAGAGFGTDTNIATLIDRGGKVEKLSKMKKGELAERIFDHLMTIVRKGKRRPETQP